MFIPIRCIAKLQISQMYGRYSNFISYNIIYVFLTTRECGVVYTFGRVGQSVCLSVCVCVFVETVADGPIYCIRVE